MIPYSLILMLTFEPQPQNSEYIASGYSELIRPAFVSDVAEGPQFNNYGTVLILEPAIPESFNEALAELNNNQLIDLDIALNEPPPNE